jgi:polyisoprenoid-binding protein YceI
VYDKPKELLMKMSVLILLTGLFMSLAVADPTTYLLTGKVTYQAKAPIGQWQGSNTALDGQLNWDAQSGEVSGQICVTLAAWSSGEPLKDRHTQEMFQVDQFPKGCFSVSGIQGDVASGQITLLGLLELHGVKHDLSIPGTFQQQSGTLIFDGNFSTNVTDWGMKRPSMLGMTVADEVQVQVHGEAVAQ